MQYQIYDNNGSGRLLEARPIITANRPIEALREYLTKNGEPDTKVKVSAALNVRFVLTPVTVQYGQIYILGGKRRTCFEVVPEKFN